MKPEEAAVAWANNFATSITATAIEPLVDIFNPNRKLELDSLDVTALKKLAVDAYLWSYKVNTSFFHHDFHPIICKLDEEFDPRNMVREGVPKVRMTTGRIITCVGLGLESSAARGPKDEPETVVQLQIPIVTAEDI